MSHACRPRSLLTSSTLLLAGTTIFLGLLPSAGAQTPRRFEVRAFQTGMPERVVELADVTGEGDIDLLSAANSNVMLWKGDGGGNFCPPAPIPTAFTEDILCADVDGDGDLDLLTAGAGVSVRKNNGLGTFSLVGTFGSEGRRLAVGDLDNNGSLDIATSDYGGGSGARTLLNQGNGSYGTQFLSPWQVATSSGIAVADVDSDGNLDLLVLEVFSGVRWIPGDGSGVFTSGTPLGPVFPPNNNWWDLDVGDIDNDGRPDVVVAGGPDDVVMVVPNVGGTLGTPITLVTQGVQQSIKLADLEGDGDLDLVSGATAYGQLTLWTNTLGSYGPGERTPALVGALSLGVADLDGDGWLDTVSTGFYSRGIAVHIGAGAAGLQGPGLLPSLYQTTSVASGDVNGDSYHDVLVGQQWPQAVSLCLGGPTGLQAPVFAFGTLGGGATSLRLFDLDNDGDRDAICISGAGVERSLGNGLGGFAPPLLTPVGLGPVSVREADLDNDGDRDLVTSHDLSGFIGAGVIKNSGGGNLAAWVSSATGSDAQAVALGDLDGNGLVDAVLAATAPVAGLLALQNIGAAQLVPWIFKPTANPRDVALADFTNDGFLDVVEIEYATSEARIHPGLGTGAFGAPIVRPVNIQPTSVVTTDIDNDLLQDLVIACENGTVQTLLSDGVGSVSYPEAYVSGSYGNSLAVGDMNLDGLPDVVVGGLNFLGLALLYGETQLIGSVQNLGFALAGQPGVPVMFFSGPMLPQSTYLLQLFGALPNAQAWLLISPCFANLPFKGGTLVPDPTVMITLPVATDGLGTFQPLGIWPSGIPSGTNMYLQMWIADPAGPMGYSAGNGLKLATP